ncbi:MAG TPA: hypothetical protein DDY37_08560 [Legionella sp.]|nr:hypothetical protein [Legionella sp.]
MIRKLGFTLLCGIGLLSSNVCSATEHMLSQAGVYEFSLPSNEPQVFTNSFFWAIESKCVISSDHENNPFTFTVLRKTGALNGIPLTKGDTVDLVVHPGEQLYITAASGGRVELINRGSTLITASCMDAK